jgi:predicted MFS family arabinose efflux permease
MGSFDKRDFIHYGWLICLAICVMQFGVGTLVNRIAGLFALPMSEALGVSRSAWTLWLTFYGVSSMVFSPIIGSLYNNQRIPVKVLMTGFVIIEIVCILLFAFCNNLWMAYLAGVLFGISEFGLRSCAMPIFANNWFSSKYRGTALGLMNCSSGIGGAFLPPIIEAIIRDSGVFYGYIACAVILAVLCLPWTVFVMVRKPADINRLPVGLDTVGNGGGG